MKSNKVLLLIFLLLPFGIFAQSGYRLDIENSIKDSVLTLDVFIQKTAGADFTLGTSNFDILLRDSDVDLKKATFSAGEFDASLHPESYDAMGAGNAYLLVQTVKVNTEGSGNGILISDKKKKIGAIQLPILNPCGTVSPEWSTSTRLNSYFKTAFGTEITKGAIFQNPKTIELDGGVSKTIPTVKLQNGKLLSSSLTQNQWYLDGVLIPGATGAEFQPIVQGIYAVEVSYPCSKNMSASVPVMTTGLSEFSISYNFAAQPNPFIGETVIGYTLQTDAVVKLQLYDLNGTHRMDLESGLKTQGKHEYLLKLSNIALPASTYVLKMTTGDKVGTLKIVALR